MKEEGHLAIPLIAIIGLLASGYTPMKAALAGIIISIATAMLRANTRMDFNDIIDGLVKGARGALGVLIACASAGMIIGIVTKTGVGLKLASALVDVAAGNFMLLLFCTMITSLILGMGVPTTANYVITSTIAAPALIQLGVPILAAHMFVFYFGIIADITPPVALAAYAGSAISGGDPLMAKDHELEWLIKHLENIPHLKRLRIHSRLPVVIPQRITDEFCRLLAQTRLQKILVTHVNHANEIDADFAHAMAKLKDCGVVLLNQSVLLKNVNDDALILKTLSDRLFSVGILPYYLHLLDKVEGATHFYLNDAQALKIYKELQRISSGYLVPKLAREIGGEPNKTLYSS